VRIISIGDGIDFPNDDDWLKIQFQFLINEMPVTDTSRKVRNVIKRRQADGEWLCAAPYGYIINSRKQFEVVPTEAETIRQIFHLYNNEGWGYKKIANHLTEQGIPTPRMSECMRKEAEGKQVTRKAKAAWAIVTVQGILDNDFYIGTLRQGKYTRAKINGKDVRRDEGEQIVIENHHQAIIDYRTFATTRALREKRTRSNYRGIKKYDNAYSGFLVCGDCGAPMFSMSRPDLAPAYTCGTYHRRGRAGCTSHHIRVDKLDELMRLYIRRVMNGSAAMIEQLNADLAQEDNQVVETEQSADNLAELLDELTEELKVTKRQRIREIMKHPENEASIEELYEEMETELQGKIDGLKHQIDLLSDRRNTIIEANRTAKTALEVFDDLLHKPKMERNDLELMIQKIDVFEDHLEVHLQADIDELLHCTAEENVVNFNSGIESAEKCRIVQCSRNQKDKTFDVSVISSGDPLEIYTDRDGEVIFKKYSPMGEMSAMAAELADALARTAGMSCAISDRDAVIAAAGGAKKDVLEKSVSAELEQLMEQRIIYARGESSLPDIPLSGRDGYRLVTAVPVITDGDVSGCVAFISEKEDTASSEVLLGLCQSAAQFLSRRIAV
jgi:stage V sporulation protein T